MTLLFQSLTEIEDRLRGPCPFPIAEEMKDLHMPEKI
jgi:hypothetical protein